MLVREALSPKTQSSDINEVIRVVLNFFFTKRFYTHKKHKKH